MKTLAILLALCLPITACQTTEGEGSKNIHGQNLGSLQLRDIDLDSGKLVLPSDNGLKIVKVRQGTLPNRYIQHVQAGDGYLVLEVTYSGGFPSDNRAKELVFLSRGYAVGGEPILPAGASEADVHRTGDVFYITGTVKGRPCVAFSRVFGRIVFGGTEQHQDSSVRGFHCGAPAADMTAEVTRTVGLAGGVRVRNP